MLWYISPCEHKPWVSIKKNEIFFIEQNTFSHVCTIYMEMGITKISMLYLDNDSTMYNSHIMYHVQTQLHSNNCLCESAQRTKDKSERIIGCHELEVNVGGTNDDLCCCLFLLQLWQMLSVN